MASKGQSALAGAGKGASIGTAILPGWGTAIGAAAGGLIGLFGGGKSEEQKAAEQAALDLEQKYQIAPEEARRIVFEHYKEIGKLTPEMEQAIALEPTAYEKVTVDPTLGAAQKQALANIQNKMNQGGLDLNDLANLQTIQLQTAQAEKGRQDAILTNAQQRGMGGSGSELAARLSSSQASADQAGQRGLSVAAQAQKNLGEQTLQSFNMAQKMSQDELNRGNSLAQAQDINSQFNANLRSGVNQRNTAARNKAQELDTTYSREIAKANTGLTNTQKVNDRNARIGYIDDSNQKLKDVLAAKTGAASSRDRSNAANAESSGNLISGIGATLLKGDEAGWFDSEATTLKKAEEAAKKKKGIVS